MRREEEDPDSPPEGTIENVFDGAIGADHTPPAERRIVVAPTADGEFNAIADPLTPVACVQLGDVLFQFDSSVISPDVKPVMKALARLREEDQRIDPEAMRPISIFGHADPSGRDDYNKALSGRRAEAVYALLTRRTDLWQSLHDNPMGGDDWRSSIPTMETAVGRPRGSTGGNVSGLFAEDMDHLCVDDQEQPYSLDPAEDFLGRGADPDGRGDYQGCSEFNPLRVLSSSERSRMARAERILADAPNRRVVIFVFRAGSRANPERWPCPAANAGAAGCRVRFFRDGDQRRAATSERREFEAEDATFACRFYHHRIATLSPCERILPQLVCGKYRGVVMDNTLGNGQVSVEVPALFQGETKNAMPAVPYADTMAGFAMLPPIGANVWVDFEQGDINRPVWSGAFWAEGEAPAEATEPDTLFIRTDNALLRMNAQSVSLESGDGKLRLESGNATLESPGGAEVALDGPVVNINRDGMKII